MYEILQSILSIDYVLSFIIIICLIRNCIGEGRRSLLGGVSGGPRGRDAGCVTGRRKSVRSTCQVHCPLDAPSFRIRVGYLRRWHFNQADTRIHLPFVDISMAAIILLYCPANNEMDATSMAMRNWERRASICTFLRHHSTVLINIDSPTRLCFLLLFRRRKLPPIFLDRDN